MGERHVLLNLEVLVLDTCLVHLDALDGDDALSGREEIGVCRGIREEEPGLCAGSINIAEP